MKVFLVGPMGTGKSTTGRNLSEKLDYDFYDTDKLIEKAERRKVTRGLRIEIENL